MNVAVVCELNPLHNGHAAVIDFARRVGGGNNNVVAVMSGNFTQRGDAAIFDKWSRAEMAVRVGADLILELPSVFAQQSAQFFADAAVDLVCRSGICDALVFGSECGDIDFLENIAEKRLDDGTAEAVKDLMQGGLSYPRALARLCGEELSPNDILGVEYLVALKKRGSKIKAIAMKRLGDKTHGDDELPGDSQNFASATAIRKALREKPSDIGFLNRFVPESCLKITKDLITRGMYVPGMNAYNSLIIGKLREIGPSGIEAFPFASGGIADCIYKAACETSEVDELVTRATSKTFTSGRIRRIVLSTLTGARKEMLSDKINVPYLRVLALSKSREDLLPSLFKTNTQVIAGNIPKNYADIFPQDAAEVLKCEILASDFYSLGFVKKDVPAHRELTVPLIKV